MKHVRWIVFLLFLAACGLTQQRPQETQYWGTSTHPNLSVYEVIDMRMLSDPEAARVELHQIDQTDLILLGNIDENTGLFRQKGGTALHDFEVEPIMLTDISVGSHAVVYGLFETSNPLIGNIYEIVVVNISK